MSGAADGRGARLHAPASPHLVGSGFATETGQARFLHRWLCVADLTHVLALLDAEVIPGRQARLLLGALLDMLDTDAAEVGYDPAHGDAYNSREHILNAKLGDDAGWLHLGRTRREAGRIAFFLATREALLDLHQQIEDLVSGTITRSVEHAESWWADTTYLQPAQVSSFGHYLLSAAHEAFRHLDRIRRAHTGCANVPIAAGGVAGTALPLARVSYLDRLGLTGAATTSRDAMWGTDTLVETAVAATQSVLTVSRLAEDFLLFASPAFGYLRVHDAHSRSSVYLPQKRNPYALSVIRGGASLLVGRATGVLTAVRTPSAQTDNWIYNYGEVFDSVRLAGELIGLTAEVVERAAFDTGRMADRALDGFTDAADLAERLVADRGMDYRSAHTEVGRLCDMAEARGDTRFSAQDYAELGLTVTPDDPRGLVSARCQEGSAALPRIRASARALRGRLTRARRWRTAAGNLAQDAARATAEEAARVVAGH